MHVYMKNKCYNYRFYVTYHKGFVTNMNVSHEEWSYIWKSKPIKILTIQNKKSMIMKT